MANITLILLLCALFCHDAALSWEEPSVKLSATSTSDVQQQQYGTATTSGSTRSSNKQAAPYAIQVQENNGGEPLKSIVLKLSLNQTGPAGESTLSDDRGQQWTLVGQNGTVLGERASADLRKLLEALNSNNLTSSEVQFDAYTSANSMNITVSLEDLLDEAKLQPSSALLNVSAIIRDNHRLIARQPARSKPVDANLAVSSMTVPPLRRTQDVVAENYTTKKIANEANIFALRLLEQLNLERLGNENIVNSPFSIYQGLGLLMAGSMGDTSRELDKLLLSVQSVYENTKLTHDQDRFRLMASFGDAVQQLQLSSSNHFQASASSEAGCQSDKLTLDCRRLFETLDRVHYRGGSEEQHFIVANNLLFSPAAYEIANEFKSTLNAYYNNTALTRMEIGSTEAIQVVNGWIRQATAGLIPAIIGKRSTFDEFNVMTMLSTSWLAQEWRNSFRRVASPLRSSIRLKGQAPVRGAKRIALLSSGQKQVCVTEPLMEFVDDQKSSHFVEYIVSEPTRLIHNYRTHLNKQLVDVVVVQFRDSNQRLVALTPLPMASDGFRGKNLAPPPPLNSTLAEAPALVEQVESVQLQTPAEASLLTKLIKNLALEPRRILRQLWSTIAPEIITKQTIQSMQTGSGGQQDSSSGKDQGSIAAAAATTATGPMPPLVQLSMPLIRLKADSSLSASLNHIGLVNAFDPAQANFIGINGHPFNYNKLHLSNVLYKTTFNLNEDGINYDQTIRTLEPMRILPQKQHVKDHKQTLDMGPGELVNEVKLNKPYMFMVVDIKTKLILYTGVVRNPMK